MLPLIKRVPIAFFHHSFSTHTSIPPSPLLLSIFLSPFPLSSTAWFAIPELPFVSSTSKQTSPSSSLSQSQNHRNSPDSQRDRSSRHSQRSRRRSHRRPAIIPLERAESFVARRVRSGNATDRSTAIQSTAAQRVEDEFDVYYAAEAEQLDGRCRRNGGALVDHVDAFENAGGRDGEKRGEDQLGDSIERRNDAGRSGEWEAARNVEGSGAAYDDGATNVCAS